MDLTEECTSTMKHTESFWCFWTENSMIGFQHETYIYKK